MVNSISASFAKYWSKRMQLKHYKTDVYRSVVSMEEQATLKKGDTVHRPYRSTLSVNDLGAQGNYTRQDITDTDESLVVNKEKEVSFYIREIDEMQSNYKTANEYADDAAVALGNQIDGDVFAETLNAVSVLDDGKIGGTAGNGVTLSTTNLDKVFGKAGELLDALDISQDGRIAVISPQVYNIIWQRIGGKATVLGDSTMMNGNKGSFANFTLHKSNNLTWTGTLALSVNPSANDTITFRGVTLTFVATVDAGTTAKQVKIASTVDLTRANLTAYLNAPTTTVADSTNAGYNAMSAAEALLFKNSTFTNSNSADTMSVVSTGVSYIVVSSVFTSGSNLWTAAKQIQHNLFCKAGCIDLVIQSAPNMRNKDRDGYLGSDIVSWTNYGKKTFTQGTQEMVDVQIRSDAF